MRSAALVALDQANAQIAESEVRVKHHQAMEAHALQIGDQLRARISH